MATWYFTGTTSEYWHDTSNWNSQSDGGGSNPAAVPWTTADTAGDNLTVGDSFFGDIVLIPGEQIGQGLTITGTANFAFFNGGFIYGGNFSGAYVQNGDNGYKFYGDGVILGGTFSSNVIVYNDNNSLIFGGNFNGMVENGRFGNYTTAIIINGYFLGEVRNGDGFSGSCLGVINGGVFVNSVTNNTNTGYIKGGIFTSYVTNNSELNGGIFTSTVTNNYSLNSGFYITKGSMKVLKWDGTYVTIKGGNTNPYPDVFMSLQYSDILGGGLL